MNCTTHTRKPRQFRLTFEQLEDISLPNSLLDLIGLSVLGMSFLPTEQPALGPALSAGSETAIILTYENSFGDEPG